MVEKIRVPAFWRKLRLSPDDDDVVLRSEGIQSRHKGMMTTITSSQSGERFVHIYSIYIYIIHIGMRVYVYIYIYYRYLIKSLLT